MPDSSGAPNERLVRSHRHITVIQSPLDWRIVVGHAEELELARDRWERAAFDDCESWHSSFLAGRLCVIDAKFYYSMVSIFGSQLSDCIAGCVQGSCLMQIQD